MPGVVRDPCYRWVLAVCLFRDPCCGASRTTLASGPAQLIARFATALTALTPRAIFHNVFATATDGQTPTLSITKIVARSATSSSGSSPRIQPTLEENRQTYTLTLLPGSNNQNKPPIAVLRPATFRWAMSIPRPHSHHRHQLLKGR
jgi:hypothetical protein